MKLIRIRFRSALLGAAVLFTSIASAGWVYDDSEAKDLRIRDDQGNWDFTVAKTVVDGVNRLTITKTNAGSGELDLTDFDVEGYDLYQFGTGNGLLSKTEGTVGYATGTLKLPQSVKVLGSYACQNSVITAVEAPGVEIIGMRSFQNNTVLETAYFPALTNVTGYGNHPSFTSPALTSLTVSPNLEYVGLFSFNCPNLKTITPSYLPKLSFVGQSGLASGGNVSAEDADWPTDFPALKSVDSSAFKGAPMSSFTAPNLETIAASAFQECKNMTSFSAPKAVVTGISAFYGCSSLVTIDIDFDALTEAYQNMFRGTLIESIDLPNVTAIGSYAFGNCPAIKRVTCSQKLTSVHADAFRNVTSLQFFEPLFPTNLTTALDAKVYGSCKLANSEVIYDFPAIPAVPASLCANPTNISKVVFNSDVTSIGNSAFPNLRPNAEVVFHGTSAPTLGTKALFYDGEGDDQRVVISFDNPDAKANWLAAVSPNATLFMESYKEQKPDYPGEKTIGILKLGSVTKPAHDVYAWVVNKAPESNKSYLVVHGVPDEIGEVSPAYGLNSGIEIGKSFDCTAPASFDDGSYKATLAGYAVSNVNELGVYTFVAEGEDNTYRYTQAEDAGDLTWVWKDRQYRIRANVQGAGSVDISDCWTPAGETVTITATPAAGQLFRFWDGDIGDANKRGQSITLTADQARTVTAVFGTEAEAKMHWVYDTSDAKNPRIYDISADGRDVNWTFVVSGTADDLKIGSGGSAWISGVGVLDLRTFNDDTGATLRRMGCCGGNNVTTLPRELTTAIYLPESVTNIAIRSFNYMSGLKTISLPGLRYLGPEAFYRSAIEGDVALPRLEVLDVMAFSGCESLTSISMPELVSIVGKRYNNGFANCLALTNIVLGAGVVDIGEYAFADLANVQRLEPRSFPNLTTVGERAFSGLGKNVADAVMPTNFPALTSVGGSSFADSAFTEIHCDRLETIPEYAFYGARLENLYAASLVSIGYRVCQGSALTNAVFSHALTNIYYVTRADWSSFGQKLRHFEPFLSTNLTCQLNNFMFGNSTLDATTELVWDFANRPEVPASLFQYPSNLQHVVFRSDVTAIGAKALHSLPPHAVVEFWGESVPTLGSEALWVTDGGTNDVRAIVKVMNRSAVPAWKAAIAENDEVFRSEYKRKKSDYPGAGTIGLLKLGTVTISKVKHNVYAWVVNANPDGFMILVR